MKKSAVRNLEKYGIIKEHPDFKEMFGFVYRGASFALVCEHAIFAGQITEKCTTATAYELEDHRVSHHRSTGRNACTDVR